MDKSKIRALTHISLSGAILAVISQIVIPIGAVPLTIQVLGVGIIGYLLGVKKGAIAVILYIMLGSVGLPVFAGFNGGLQALFSYTGGFIFGFLPLVIMCGIFKTGYKAIISGIIGVFLCHILGAIQYMLIGRLGLVESIAVSSLPFLLKDIIFVVLAYFISKAVHKSIKNKPLH